MFWKILSTRSGHFGHFGNFGNFGKIGNPESAAIPKFPKSPPLCFGKSCPLGRAILEILEISEILEVLEIRKVRGFQLMFWKILPTRSEEFGNLEISEILEISANSEFWEILEIREILDFLENLEFLELIYRRADSDSSDDRPCTTTHLQRQGLSILMPIFRRISIYGYICLDTPTNTTTNTNTDIDHLLNAQASTSIPSNITRL